MAKILVEISNSTNPFPSEHFLVQSQQWIRIMSEFCSELTTKTAERHH